MKYVRKIVGERVYLSPMNPEDSGIYAKWMNDFAVTGGLGVSDFANSELSELEWVEDNLKKLNHQYAIVLKENDELIGNIGLESIQQINRHCDVGLFIGEEKHRGKGYGTEALKLAVRYAFDKLNMHSIHLNVFDFNVGAIKSYKKVGFREAGRLREEHFHDGKYCDKLIMDILREDLKD